MNEQGSCYKCLCKLFNIFWCFRVENWYDNSVSINSIFIDKIDNPNSNIDNYRLLTPNSFIEQLSSFEKINRFLSIVIERYRLSILSNDYAGLCFVNLLSKCSSLLKHNVWTIIVWKGMYLPLATLSKKVSQLASELVRTNSKLPA